MSLAARKRKERYQSYYGEPKAKAKQSLLVRPLGWLFFALVTSVLLSLALSVCFRAAMTSDSFACNELQKKIQEQVVQGKKLEKQVALLSSPRRVEKIALTKIKMVKPKKVYFLHLSDSSPVSYSFKKPSIKLRPSGWLDDLLDKVVLLKADQRLVYGNQ